MNTETSSTLLAIPPAARPDPARASARREIPSRDLFRSGQEIVIEHEGQAYRLRITRQNKLILTK